MTKHIGLAALISVATITAMPSPAEANQFKRIRDVNVACTGALQCDIYSTNRRVTLNSFGFRRSASPDAPLQIVLGARQSLAAGSEVVFTIDGQEIMTLLASAFSYRAATYQYFYQDEEPLRALLRAARAGDTLEISHTTRQGRSTVPFSLSGFTAGLIFADEVQGRIGDSDALMALSDRSAPVDGETETGGTIVEVNSWAEVPDTVLADYGTDALRCSNEADDNQRPPLGGYQVQLDDNTSLISLPCGDPGAYNFPSAFWLARGDAVAALPMPDISDRGPTITDVVWNAGWNAEAREVEAFFKGRGLGDCGLYNRWALEGSDGFYRFVLLEARNKDNCDGVYREDLSDYNQLWPLP